MGKKIFYIAITCIFLLIFLLPPLQQMTGMLPKLQLIENRYVAPMPKMTWDSLASGMFQFQFDAYMNDNYGFRGILVMINNQINLTIFKVTR